MAKGSSPLTRGKRGRVGAQEGVEGLIPAHAGKTVVTVHLSMWLRAHPRSRGENLKWGCLAVAVLGSSPLTRGKQNDARGIARVVGLIPAHAGKTAKCCGLCGGWRAHPRSRGENRMTLGELHAWLGSSPLTRGKHASDTPHTPLVRLIPAHAGKTEVAQEALRGRRAHPRSRGENPSTASALPSCPGSSPLTRGKPSELLLSGARHGLIPAHAGKTSPRITPRSGRRAHPRSRGENSLMFW